MLHGRLVQRSLALPPLPQKHTHVHLERDTHTLPSATWFSSKPSYATLSCALTHVTLASNPPERDCMWHANSQTHKLVLL